VTALSPKGALIALCAMLIACAFLVHHRKEDSFPRLFDGPNVLGHPDKGLHDAEMAKLNKALQPAFDQIDPYSSLLIICDIQAGLCTNYPFSTELQAFLTDAVNAESGWRKAMAYTAQMIPMAVDMRFDLAGWNGSAWSGAELRFLYSVDQVQDTVILEFVLQDMSWPVFQGLANQWGSLSKSSATYAADLANAVTAANVAGAQKLRIRTNRFLSFQKWELAEWDFLIKNQTFDGSTALCPGALEDQLASDPGIDAFSSVAQQLGAGVLVTMPGSLASGFKKNQPTGYSMGMPENVPFNNPANQAARNLLALRQCTWCHTRETGTNFRHVSRDPTSGSITLSDYLTSGLDSSSHRRKRPTIEGLYEASIDSVAPLQVPFQWGTTPETSTRSFSDLARRRGFLSALINSTPMDTSSLQAILAFQQDFAH
jgi:hypothetical protein